MRELRSVVAIAVFAAVCTPALAVRPDDYIGRAMELFRRLYPRLSDIRVVIGVEGDLYNRPATYRDAVANFTMTLFHPSSPPTIDRGFVGPEDVLYSRFVFHAEQKQVLELRIWGPLPEANLENFSAELEKHPEWSYVQKVQALKRAGAKFGPDDRTAFTRALPLKELEVVIDHLDVLSADFALRYAPLNPKWDVRAKWRSEDGQFEALYKLSFEPFDGRLTELSIISGVEPKR